MGCAFYRNGTIAVIFCGHIPVSAIRQVHRIASQIPSYGDACHYRRQGIYLPGIFHCFQGNIFAIIRGGIGKYLASEATVFYDGSWYAKYGNRTAAEILCYQTHDTFRRFRIATQISSRR
jgi:hypothetical protein